MSDKAYALHDRVNSLFLYGAVAYPPSGDTSGVKDLANMQQILNGGGPLRLGASSGYYVNGALSVPTGAVIQGAGMGVTTINQVSTSADVLAMTGKRYIAVRDLKILGPGSGTADGIHFSYTSGAALASISLANLWIKDMGSNGVSCDTLITSDLTNVRVETCGADNFYLANCTSTDVRNCYANGPTASSGATGFRLNNCRYMALSACAADNVTDPNGAYFIQGGDGIMLVGCGCENPVTGFKVSSSSKSVKFAGCRVLGLTGVGYLITGTSLSCTIDTCEEASPGGGATASIKVDSGSTAVVIGLNVVTAAVYAAGTAYVITHTGGVTH